MENSENPPVTTKVNENPDGICTRVRNEIKRVSELAKEYFAISMILIAIIGGMWAFHTQSIKDLKYKYDKITSEFEVMLENHKSKIDFLESQVGQLRYENTKYLKWLESKPQSIPFLEKHIKETDEKLSMLESTAINLVTPKPPAEPEGTYLYFKELKKGNAFVDPLTGATLGISEIYNDNTAPIALTLPGQQTQNLLRVLPGTSWGYLYKGITYRITITKINWTIDNFQVEVREIGK